MELKIIAELTINDGENTETIKKALYNVVNATRKEEGCISYELHQDIADPKRFVFIEVWKSQEAIDNHNASLHFQDFVKEVEGKVSLNVSVIEKIY